MEQKHKKSKINTWKPKASQKFVDYDGKLYIVNFKLLSLDLFFYGFDFEYDFLKVLLEPFDFLFYVGHE